MTRIMTKKEEAQQRASRTGAARGQPDRSSLDADVTHDGLTSPRFLGRLGNLFTGKERTF